MTYEIVIAGSLGMDEIEARCRVATEELQRDLDALEAHLSASIEELGVEDPGRAMSLWSALSWVRYQREGRLQRALAQIAESI